MRARRVRSPVSATDLLDERIRRASNVRERTRETEEGCHQTVVEIVPHNEAAAQLYVYIWHGPDAAVEIRAGDTSFTFELDDKALHQADALAAARQTIRAIADGCFQETVWYRGSDVVRVMGSVRLGDGSVLRRTYQYRPVKALDHRKEQTYSAY